MIVCGAEAGGQGAVLCLKPARQEGGIRAVQRLAYGVALRLIELAPQFEQHLAGELAFDGCRHIRLARGPRPLAGQEITQTSQLVCRLIGEYFRQCRAAMRQVTHDRHAG